jgi:hypothetical protein
LWNRRKAKLSRRLKEAAEGQEHAVMLQCQRDWEDRYKPCTYVRNRHRCKECIDARKGCNMNDTELTYKRPSGLYLEKKDEQPSDDEESTRDRVSSTEARKALRDRPGTPAPRGRPLAPKRVRDAPKDQGSASRDSSSKKTGARRKRGRMSRAGNSASDRVDEDITEEQREGGDSQSVVPETDDEADDIPTGKCDQWWR